MVRPVEETDPEFAGLLLDVVRHNSSSAYPKIAIQHGKVYHNFGNTWSEVEATRDAVPGRNDLCFCGSGKKFKKCCGMT